MDLQIKGKTALVTGASIGIGRGIALALGREGARLALVARRTGLLEEVAGEIVAAGGAKPVLVVEDPAPSLRWYARRNLIPVDRLPRELDRWRAADSLVYLAFRPMRERGVAAAAPGTLEVLARTPALVVARVRP